ncbi:MAG: nitroreductase family protein [Bacilli bacterium]|nr:nitroreductase family protein [Bacilli bacterium]
MQEIYVRRSIRKYLDKEISDEDIKKILKAGMNAPTARNLKPYEFVVVRNKETLSKLSEMKKNAYFAKDSNVTIVLLAKELSDYWQQDLGAVSENMLLEATRLGIGSCWVGITPNQDYENYVRGVLGIPQEVRVFSLMTLGYPGEVKQPNDNYYEEKVHYEKY